MKTYRILVAMTLVAIIGVCAKSVDAFPQFSSGFKKLYLTDDAPEDFKDAVKGAKCALCHDDSKKNDKGKADRKYRNPYGQALDNLLSKDDKKDKEKIREALQEIEGEKAPGSEETFGDRLKNHQFPYAAEE